MLKIKAVNSPNQQTATSIGDTGSSQQAAQTISLSSAPNGPHLTVIPTNANNVRTGNLIQVSKHKSGTRIDVIQFFFCLSTLLFICCIFRWLFPCSIFVMGFLVLNFHMKVENVIFRYFFNHMIMIFWWFADWNCFFFQSQCKCDILFFFI